MTGSELGQLLAGAAGEAERSAPPLDPLRALDRARARVRQRRGHLVVGAFVLFTFLLQAAPSDALGAHQPLHAAGASAATPAVDDPRAQAGVRWNPRGT